MAANLVRVFRNVYKKFREGFEDKTEIMDKFGGNWIGVDMGLYSRLAKLLQKSNLLHLETISLEGGLSDDANDKYSNVLESHGWCQTDIDLFLGQLKDNTIELVMRRMRRFRAGARMSSVAAQLPDDENQIPDYMMTMIDNIANTLGKGHKRIIKSLYKIKANQTIGGERLSLLSKLASVYNSTKGDESDKEAVVRGDDRLEKLMKSYKIDDKEKAIEMIKNTAAAQEGLALLPQLASVYNSTKGDESIKEAVIEGDGRLNELMKAYKIDDKEKAIEMIKNTAAAQEYLALFNRLASEYNHAGGGAKGRIAIEGSNLERLVTLSRHGNKDMVVKKIEKLAQKCDQTFWKNYKQLVAYKKKHGMVTVGKDKVLYVHKSLAKNNEYDYLYNWLAAMVNYSGVEGNRLKQTTFGVVAHERVGSVEYDALVDLGVVFNNDSLMSAAHKKIEDDRRKDSGNTSNIEGGFTGVRARLFSKKSN